MKKVRHIEELLHATLDVTEEIRTGKLSVAKGKAVIFGYSVANRIVCTELKAQLEKYKNHNVKFCSVRPPEPSATTIPKGSTPNRVVGGSARRVFSAKKTR